MASSRFAPIALLAALVTLVPAAQAQYKWVAPDGTVSYGDQPPPQASKLDHSAVQKPRDTGDPRLPYALRTAVSKYPVKLYTTANCGPCDAARQHLTKRGVPFSEHLLRSQADIDALQRQGFASANVPAISVGRERQTGFEAGAWDALLDTATYPKTSMLPAGWKPQEAEPLTPEPVAERDPAAGKAGAGADQRARANDRAQARDTPVLPAAGQGGIRF